jgi:hypothetical protein
MARRLLLVTAMAIGLMIPASAASADIFIGDCDDPEWSFTVRTGIPNQDVHACGDWPV